MSKSADHNGVAIEARRGLNVLAMPMGPVCDLDCAYCYYLRKTELYPGNRHWAMSEETLDAFVQQYIAAQPGETPEVIFGWQGGEPTLLPLEFFEHVIQLQRRYAPAGVRCVNTIQTNGVSLDDDWCRFLKANDFLVGLSLDGPAHLHDPHRVDKQGRPTHARVMHGLQRLQRHGVEFNVLCVVNRLNGDHPQEVYGFFHESDVEFLQFIPLVEPMSDSGSEGATSTRAQSKDLLAQPEEFAKPAPFAMPEQAVSSRSVLPEQFGSFLVGVFEQWRNGDVGRIFVQMFDQALSAWMGLEPSMCIFQRECGRALALEHNGDVYSCDHFVTPQHRLGNIHQVSLTVLADRPEQIAFGRAKHTTLPNYCRQCEYLFACRGECPKNRLILSPAGERGLNYLCAGYKKFFGHVDPYMRQMADSILKNVPAAQRTVSPAADVSEEV